MTKEAANPLEEDALFGGIDFGDLEDSLLTVDLADGEVPEVEKVIKEVAGGSGEPPKITDDDPPAGEKPVVKKVEPDLLVVDKPAAEEEDDPSKDDDKTKKGIEAKKDEEILSPMYLHAAALQEYGLLPDFDLTTIKDLQPEEQVLKVNEAIQKSVEEAKDELVKSEIDKFIGPTKKFYEDLKAGISFNALAENASLEEQYGSITAKNLEDDEDAQEAIFSDSLSMKGLSEGKIKQLIQVAKDNDVLLNESLDGLKEIQAAIKQEREEMRRHNELAKKERDQRNEETQKKISSTVSTTKEIIPGIELVKAEHEQLIKDMTVPVKFITNSNGQEVPVSKVMEFRSKDPISFDMKLNYFIQKGFFDKDAKFDNLSMKATTSATKKLIEKMNSTKPSATGTPSVDVNKNEEKEEFIFPFTT